MRVMIASAAVFGVISVAVWHWNRALFQQINGHSTPMLDHIFGLISGLGDGLIAVVLIMVVALYHTRLGCTALLAFLLSGTIAQLLKRLFDMPRPPALLDHVHLLGAPLQSHSFPSGHATTDGMMAAAAILLGSANGQPRWIGMVIALLFLLAAIGRIYGGVHFPQDVWVGLTIGIVTMAGCWRWSARWPITAWQRQQWWLPIVGLLLAGLACVLGLGYRVQPLTAQPLALLIPLLALFLLAKRWKTIA
ncbi:MAG: phosphatase PAP2 family protein [Mariprofundales bacterium]